MNEGHINRVEEKIAAGYSFSTNDYLKRAWEMYKEEAGSFIGFLFITMIIAVAASVIPIIGVMINSLVLSPALIAGYYLVSNKIDKREPVEFSNFFDGFKFIVPLMLQTLVFSLILLVAFSPTIFVLFQSGIIEWYMDILGNPFDPPGYLPDFGTTAILVAILNLIPVVYLVVSYIFAPHFIIFYNMQFWDAMEMSRRLVTKRWFSVFSIYLLVFGIIFSVFMAIGLFTVLLPVLGVLLLIGVGLAVFLLSPVIYILFYVAFADITGLLEEGDEQELLDHLIA
jgi:hypothetical protein